MDGRRSLVLTLAMTAVIAGSAAAASPVPIRQEGGGDPSPSPAPVASALPGASPVASGASLVFQETFDAPSDLWWTGRDSREDTEIAEGWLRTTLRGRGSNSTWQWADLPQPLASMRVDITVLVTQGPGGGGPMCGDASGDGAWYWAGVNESGEWLLGWVTGSRVHVEQRGERPDLADPDAPPGAGLLPVTLTLDCAVDPEGGPDQVTFAVAGEPVAMMTKRQIGPYSQAGFIVAGDKSGVTVFLDDLHVWDMAAQAAVGSPSPSAPASSVGAGAPAAP